MKRVRLGASGGDTGQADDRGEAPARRSGPEVRQRLDRSVEAFPSQELTELAAFGG